MAPPRRPGLLPASARAAAWLIALPLMAFLAARSAADRGAAGPLAFAFLGGLGTLAVLAWMPGPYALIVGLTVLAAYVSAMRKRASGPQ